MTYCQIVASSELLLNRGKLWARMMRQENCFPLLIMKVNAGFHLRETLLEALLLQTFCSIHLETGLSEAPHYELKRPIGVQRLTEAVLLVLFVGVAGRGSADYSLIQSSYGVDDPCRTTRVPSSVDMIVPNAQAATT
jgi:hypothetical protein